MNKEVQLVVIVALVAILPIALAPNPMPYIVGFLLWGSIMYILEKNQVEDNGKGGYTRPA